MIKLRNCLIALVLILALSGCNKDVFYSAVSGRLIDNDTENGIAGVNVYAYTSEEERDSAFNSWKSGTIFSDNPEEVNLDNQHCDIIISTIKSCGTGFNPPNLQTIICGEPHTSRIMTHQLKGRLDRFKGNATYFYDLIDKSIPFMDNVESAHQKELEPMCAEVVPIYI